MQEGLRHLKQCSVWRRKHPNGLRTLTAFKGEHPDSLGQRSLDNEWSPTEILPKGLFMIIMKM